MSEWKLYYDGGCNLCHASKLRVEVWAKKAHQPLTVDILLSDEAIAKGYADAMVLEADGEVFSAATAWMQIMTIAPWYLRWVSVMRKTKLTMALATWAYGVVAKYRIRVFGSRACQVPQRPQ